MTRVSHRTFITPLLATALLGVLLALPAARAQAGAAEAFRIGPGERVVFLGNTFAERMQHFPHFEMLITLRQPDDGITFRNLGWSGDEVALQPRPFGFGDLHTHLAEQRADVVFAAFGMNESFAGPAGVAAFRAELRRFLQELGSHSYNGRSPARLVLVSPIAHERVAAVPLDPTTRNRDLGVYTEAMREVAAELDVRFIDLHTPTARLFADPAHGAYTINGIHLNEHGYRLASELMARSLGWTVPPAMEGPALERLQRLRRAIEDKNELFFLRWRAVNGEYIYGRRKEPFGVVDFPPEMRQLEAMIAAMEDGIRQRAREVAR
jgi:hypothetical protein